MRPLLRALILLLAIGSAQATEPVSVEGPGFRLSLPGAWDLRRNATEVPLYGRSREHGWEGVTLSVDSRRLDDPASCLDGQTQRRLRSLQARAAEFEQESEQRLQLDGLPAYEYVLHYRLGEHRYSAYLLSIAAEGRWAYALLAAEPAVFELRRRELRQIVESLRPRAYAGADYQPPRKS